MPVSNKSLILFTLICLACSGDNANELAIIGSRVITTKDFINRFKMIKQKINLPDNGRTRSEILKNMVKENLLISEAEYRDYQNDQIGQVEIEKIKLKEIINLYLQKNVFSSDRISDNDLKSLYIRLNTKIKARHLYAASRTEADALYQKIIDGENFEALAKEVFKDPQLHKTGGDLGYFTVDEMDPGFEDAAFMLKIGQISKPVKTAQGYSIIQVQERITKPLLIESEYVKHKSKLEGYWQHRMQKKSAQAFSDSIRKKLNISFNHTALTNILTELEKEKNFIEFSSDGIEKLNNNGLMKNQEVVRFEAGEWDLKTLREKAKFTSEKQEKLIKNLENLEDFIAGLLVRDYIISDAKKLNLHKSSEYETAIRQKSDDYLYQRIINTITENIEIPEDSLLAYYQANKDQFINPPKIRLSEIVLDNEVKANEVNDMLLKNASFADLVKKYSVRKWSAENQGDLGSFRSEELGIYTDRLMSLEIGRWTGPVKMDDKFVFFKCTAKYPVRSQSFDEARPEIVKIIKPRWESKFKEKILADIRSHTQVVTFPEKLKTIRLN